MRRNRQRIRKIPLKSTISEGFWSEWGDSNARSLEPKSSAIPTSLHPDIHFPVMIPRRAVKIKFFLSVVIYVVKGDFVPLSAIGENPANAGVARLCGVSPHPIPDTATALPKQARYQLRYTRLFRYFIRLVVFSQTRRDTSFAIPGYPIFPPAPENYSLSYHGAAEKATVGRRKSAPTVICRFTRLPVSLAAPTAALRPPGTDPRRWTAGTCRPSAAPDSGR